MEQLLGGSGHLRTRTKKCLNFKKIPCSLAVLGLTTLVRACSDVVTRVFLYIMNGNLFDWLCAKCNKSMRVSPQRMDALVIEDPLSEDETWEDSI